MERVFYRVNMSVLNKGQVAEIWFVMSSEHETMADVFTALVRDGFLLGIRYETAPDGAGRRVIRDEAEIIIGRDGLRTIQEMQDELFEEDGTPVWTYEMDEAARAAREQAA